MKTTPRHSPRGAGVRQICNDIEALAVTHQDCRKRERAACTHRNQRPGQTHPSRSARDNKRVSTYLPCLAHTPTKYHACMPPASGRTAGQSVPSVIQYSEAKTAATLHLIISSTSSAAASNGSVGKHTPKCRLYNVSLSLTHTLSLFPSHTPSLSLFPSTDNLSLQSTRICRALRCIHPISTYPATSPAVFLPPPPPPASASVSCLPPSYGGKTKHQFVATGASSLAPSQPKHEHPPYPLRCAQENAWTAIDTSQVEARSRAGKQSSAISRCLLLDRAYQSITTFFPPAMSQATSATDKEASHILPTPPHALFCSSTRGRRPSISVAPAHQTRPHSTPPHPHQTLDILRNKTNES